MLQLKRDFRQQLQKRMRLTVSVPVVLDPSVVTDTTTADDANTNSNANAGDINANVVTIGEVNRHADSVGDADRNVGDDVSADNTTTNNNSNNANTTATDVDVDVDVDTTAHSMNMNSVSMKHMNMSSMTPQAFLARDPQQLCDDLSMSMEDVLEWRCQLATQLRTTRMNEHQHHHRHGCNNGNGKGSGHNNAQDQVPQQEQEHAGSGPGSCNKPLFVGAVSALELYHAQQRQHKTQTTSLTISTGSVALDKLFLSTSHTYRSGLGVGLVGGTVVEVVGEPSSGKTQLALSVACRALLWIDPQQHPQVQVHYLVSGGSTSVTALTRRLSRLLDSHMNQKQHNSNHQHQHPHNHQQHHLRNNKRTAVQCLEHIHFTLVRDGYQVLAALDRIVDPKNMNTGTVTGHEQQEHYQHHHNVIILDSASGCLTNHTLLEDNTRTSTAGGGGCDSGVALVNQVGIQLRQVARQTGSVVLVLNGLVKANHPYANTSTAIASSSYLKQGTLQPALVSLKQPKYDAWRPQDVRIGLEIIGNMTVLNHKKNKSIQAFVMDRPSQTMTTNGDDSLLHCQFAIDASGVTDVK
jgi:hypothetical protein